MSKDSNRIQLSMCMWWPLKYTCYSVSDIMIYSHHQRKILTVPTSDGENNILSRIGGMSEELYVPRVAPQASPQGKPSGMPLGQNSGHTNLVKVSCFVDHFVESQGF